MKNIYFDYAATTPLSEKVKEEMVNNILSNIDFGNSGSVTHEFGELANKNIESARKIIADTLGVLPREIIFTSGATESNNLAIKGVLESYQNRGNHIITSKIEHKAVLEVCQYLETRGCYVTYLEVDNKGNISLDDLENAITEQTVLISLMAVNNELGVKNDLAKIGKIAKRNNILFHVDAAQGYGKIDINIKEMNINLLSVSGHKIYGPKGIGFLYVSSKSPKVKLQKQIHGGAQEFSKRAGTLANHQILGLSIAAEEIFINKQENTDHIRNLRDVFLKELNKEHYIKINTDLNNSYEGILNITFELIKGETLLAMLNEFALSMGSACTSSSIEPSHVLTAIGLTAEEADSSLRVSFGTMTTVDDVKSLAKVINHKVKLLRSLLPNKDYADV
ncbi:cysteine desulfurase family protein [Francisella frigiditurris]|uniref:cysteine desulfurase n=1 Tax=Francisella frigiditurris TaxID=1542390 RepID=A0A1J0KUT6_9GAMM|nr:cysteine desulfurase family protein [Francisella frigiditurris]APC97451.1 beta-eliminating lyase family protein [Francisella frigiditurris]